MSAELTRRQKEYERALASSGVGALLDQQAVSSPDVARRIEDRLPPGTAMLSYFLTPMSVSVVALARGHEPIVAQTEVIPAVLEGRIRRIGSELLSRSRQSNVERDAAELSRILLGAEPVRALLTSPEIRSLIIVPHAMLHEVPFSFLPFEGAHLVERFVIRILPYGGMLLTAAEQSRAEPAVGSPAASIMAYSGDDPSHALVAAHHEADRIAAVYGVTPKFAPRRENLLAALQRPGIVHLIAHGRSPHRLGPDASIDLPRRSQSDDGDLVVSDIVLADSRLAASVVVLASCQLAQGRRTPGDEATGIPRALLQKGVGTVIAPLWQIQDAMPVVELMTTIHSMLRKGSLPAAEALARAQRHAIHHGVAPAHWAGFLAIGGASR